MSMYGSCCAAIWAGVAPGPRPSFAGSSTASSTGRRHMARILWLNWSGGGNLPPSLGIARVLTERGHTVAFAGRPEMAPRVKTAGLRAIEITQAYEQVERYPQGSFLTRMSCYLTSPAV